jgi:D-methionine transport system permease protein
MKALIIQAFFETIIMVAASFSIGIIFGVPLAIILYNSSSTGLKKNKLIYLGLGFLVNAARSIPYIILTILLLPVGRFIVGTTIGVYAAIVPLSLSAILLIAKAVEEALKTVPLGVIEAGIAMGASHRQIIWKIIIPESISNIVASLTLILINLVGFSAMAGTVGGGGLGDLAIRYGYQRYNIEVMLIIIVILIFLVQTIQYVGNKISITQRK